MDATKVAEEQIEILKKLQADVTGDPDLAIRISDQILHLLKFHYHPMS